MWHVSSRSGVATLRTAIHLLLWGKVFRLVGSVPRGGMVVFAGDMDERVGGGGVGCALTHGGFGCG